MYRLLRFLMEKSGTRGLRITPVEIAKEIDLLSEVDVYAAIAEGLKHEFLERSVDSLLDRPIYRVTELGAEYLGRYSR